MENNEHAVYARIDSSGYITAVNSSAFLEDTTGWVQIDEGTGDRYHHAQGNYFPLPLITEGGAYRYKLVDGVVAECTTQEIEDQEAANRPESDPGPSPGGTAEAQLAEMAAAIERGLTT